MNWWYALPCLLSTAALVYVVATRMETPADQRSATPLILLACALSFGCLLISIRNLPIRREDSVMGLHEL